MGRIIKSIAPYWKSVILIIMLLLMQAYCDLALPQYTSDIIDTGIQNGGIEHIMPEAILEEEHKFATIFMTEEEKVIWNEIYSPDTLTLVDNQVVYKLNVTNEEKLNEYDEKLILPLIINYQMNDEQKQQLKQYIDMDGEQSSGQMLSKIREEASKTVNAMGTSLVKSIGIAYAKAQDSKAGLDMDAIQTKYLVVSGLKMVAMALLMAAVSVAIGFLAARVGAGIGRDLRGKVYSKVMSFSNSEMDSFSTASLITRTTNDVQQIQMVSVMMLRMVCYAPILGIGGILKVSETGAGMEWIIALSVGVILGFVLLLMAIAMPKFKLMQKLVDGVNLVSIEILTGISVIRAFGREEKEEKRFDKANVELTRTMLFTNRVMAFMMPVMTIIMNGTSILIVWTAAHRIDSGAMQVGDMTAFITYSMQIVMSFLVLTMMSVILPRAAVSAERIDAVLNTKPSIMAPQNPTHIDKCQGFVSFEHVDFRYPGADNDVLTDIDFTAEPGKTTAIVGSTGCGKSTIINLIPRIFDVTKGSIKLDGIDIREMSLKELRQNIGYVPQKGVLFSGTIASNLRYGRDDATEEELKEAALIAQAMEFIEEKNGKYEAHISQGGSNVSGGQKQRLAIARAIVKNAKIYIFDDSFSALDLKTDAALRKALANKVKDSTVIIVAQRISTVIHADKIIVVDDGRIVGKGTHEELLANCEVYGQIARSQMSAKELGLEE